MPGALTRLVQRCLEKDRDAACKPHGTSPASCTTSLDARRRIQREVPTRAAAARTRASGWRCCRSSTGGSSAEVAGLAEGLSEEIVTGLARFSYLRVIAHSATLRSSESADVRTVAREIGARYVMEGSVKQAGSQVRIAVQLVDATTGAHLWAETYSRPFQADAIFALQDDLAPRIVSTVADSHGVLPRSMGDALRGRASSGLTPYEAVLRGYSFYARIGAAEHADVRAALEHAAGQAADNADVWALLSMLFRTSIDTASTRVPIS